MALTVTVAGATSDSYATVAEADAVFELTQDSTWTGASTANKEAALKRAAQIIDLGRYYGIKSAVTQALRFPSHYMRNSSGTLVVPAEIKRAQSLLALALLHEPNLLSGPPAGLSSVTIDGSASVSFGGSTGSTGDPADVFERLPASVKVEIRRHIWRSGPEPFYSWDPATRTFR